MLWYALSLFYVLLLSVWKEQRLQAVLQVITDLVMVTWSSTATGGWDSSLNFLYPLVIIVACILLPQLVGVPDAALGLAPLRPGAGTELLRGDPSYSTTHPELKSLQAIVFVNLFAYLAVALPGGPARLRNCARSTSN